MMATGGGNGMTALYLVRHAGPTAPLIRRTPCVERRRPRRCSARLRRVCYEGVPPACDAFA
ncbi:hypothetical protein D8L93_00830, partial [Sodalis-like symbiont of Bactericera trigonica]